MTLSEELTWRGFVNQTTYKDISVLDQKQIVFYWGVDPSADSMQIGNFAMAMMVRHFINHGHKAILLVGGATGLIGDPDGKKQERDLLSLEQLEHNKKSIAAQYRTVFAEKDFVIVDNYDWFSGINYLDFLRDVGKYVPMRQMLGREFIQSRLHDDGDGISYAEFSYALIQGYDFLHLSREHGVTLQVAGADQWGNSIAGVELIRRIDRGEAHVWTGPLIVNKSTGVKFGKSEAGAIWLDPTKTSPTQFYQFWVNCDDAGVEDYLKVYTLLDKPAIDDIIAEHDLHPEKRLAQKRLAQEVTILVHGTNEMQTAETITDYLVGNILIGEASDTMVTSIKREIPFAAINVTASIIDTLTQVGLASSNSEARRLIQGNAISINGQKVDRDQFEANDFKSGRLLLKRGKAFKDSAIIEAVS